VPAYERADSVAATVGALRALADVDEVVVVDDGSRDATADVARAAGARVVRLPVNVGKGGAVAAGVAASPDADTYLLLDADVGPTATAARALLDPVLADDADMTIGVLPSAGRRGGFGLVRNLSRWGISRACGFVAVAPLSGQRAVRADLLRSLKPAARFGLEVGLTIDAVRQGARVLEVPVALDHRHTGRRLSGFAHRGRQGSDVVRALWPRLTSARSRIVLILAASLLGTVARP
jgi:glycosyltransferase involved in cell wall biosynthesis